MLVCTTMTVHRFELADGMNNAFRRSTSNASTAGTISMYGACRMSCGVAYVVYHPSLESKNQEEIKFNPYPHPPPTSIPSHLSLDHPLFAPSHFTSSSASAPASSSSSSSRTLNDTFIPSSSLFIATPPRLAPYDPTPMPYPTLYPYSNTTSSAHTRMHTQQPKLFMNESRRW